MWMTKASGLLTTHDGDPVWPIERDADALALRNLARLFGDRIVECDTHEGVVGATPVGRVLAITERAAVQGRLYAHLTRRAFDVIGRGSDLASHPDADVIVGFWDQLHFEVLDACHRRIEGGRPVGIVVAGNTEELHREVLLRSAAASLDPSADAGALALVPDRATVGATLSGLRIVTGRTESSEKEPSSTTGLLLFHAHGDGLDQQLPEGRVLCPMLDRSRSREGEGQWGVAPDCAAGQRCYRLDVALSEALASPRLVAPSSVEARALILSSCLAIPAVGSAPSPEWALLPALLRHATVGGILAPWGLGSGAFLDQLPLVARLLSGSSVGEALVLAHATLGRNASLTRYCLFGDPRTRAFPRREASAVAGGRVVDVVSRSVSGAALPAPIRREPSPRADAGRDLRGDRALFAELLRRIVEEPKRGAEEYTQRLAEAQSLVGDPRSDWTPEIDTRWSEIRGGVLTALSQAGAVWSHFAAISGRPRVVPGEGACACGRSLRFLRWSMPRPVRDRLQGQCDVCGIVVDVIEGSRHQHTRVDLRPTSAAVGNDGVMGSIVAALTVTDWRRESRTMLVPSSGVVTLPELSPGRTSARVTALDGFEIVFVRRQITGREPCRPAHIALEVARDLPRRIDQPS
jgi:hypothetical protein